MEAMTIPYTPTEEQCKFHSEANAVRYARDAGYSVARQDDGKIVASRPDLEKSCVLTPTGDKFYWKRDN